MSMRDIFNAGSVTIEIDEFGRRVWVCIESEGTVLRLGRITQLTIDDNRIAAQKESDNEQLEAYVEALELVVRSKLGEEFIPDPIECLSLKEMSDENLDP